MSRDLMLRRYPAGAEYADGQTSFRVWAPGHSEVDVMVEGRSYPLEADRDGYFQGVVTGVEPGRPYQFRLSGSETLYPDPASRAQPEGPLGPSQVVDATSFAWADTAWPGLTIANQVLYELHVGTFTSEGTWAAAVERLPFLKDIGITAIEMMPVAAFTGSFGWGYDGVDLFAPTHLYGEPDDLKLFIDRAHALGLGVILDVVYNHFGPCGNFLDKFSPDYFTDRYENEWGAALNFDGPNSNGMRDLVISNAAYWIEEFHFDGLRLDATQSIHDASDDHVVAALARAARAAAGQRSIIIVAENEPQNTDLVRPGSEGGFGLDAVWNDDLHHSAMVALTGRSEAYYEDHEGKPQEFISAAKHGYLFQGQTYFHQKQSRGKPGLNLDPSAFVTFVQNHDQIANCALSVRFQQLTSPGRARAMTALMLLMPGTPMLFQGQEFWSSKPFRYFADHEPELARAVRTGRRDFLRQFPSLDNETALAILKDPHAPETFTECKLDWAEADTHAGIVDMHGDLLAIRRSHPAIAANRKGGMDGAVLGDEAFAFRYFGPDGEDCLLVVNFGRDLKPRSIPDPLLAPPQGRGWTTLWSSEHPRYGGSGTAPFETKLGWYLPGHAAVLLAPAAAV